MKRFDRRELLQLAGATGAMAALGGCAWRPRVSALGGFDGTLRDGCWLYGHDSGDHDGLGDSPMNFYNVPLSAPLTVADAAHGFGLENVCVCRWGLTDDDYLRQYHDLKRVSWVITGARNTRYSTLLEHNFALLDKMPNLVAFDLDDYFKRTPPGQDERVTIDGREVVSAQAVIPYDELRRLRRRTKTRTDRDLALQLVVYDYQLREEMRPVFDSVDVVQYWTWCGKDISGLSERFRQYRRLAPGKPTCLGIYMWDYGNRKPLEMSFMKQQLEVGFGLWQKGEVEGFVFHCSNLLNKNLRPAEYARAWFREHADETRPSAVFRPVAGPPETMLSFGVINVPDLSTSGTRMRVIRAEADAAGKRNVPLRIGGDEWLPFTGETGRQVLACGAGRVMIVEPSGRVAWRREDCGTVSCVRLKDGQIYYSNGRLNRVRYALPCDPHAPVETVYRGPTEADDVRSFDFTRDGTIVVAADDRIVDLNAETFVPNVWIRAGAGVKAAHKTHEGTYLGIFDHAVCEYDNRGAPMAELKIADRIVGDAVRLADGKTLVACGNEIRLYAADGGFTCVFAGAAEFGLAGARLGSLQRLADGSLVVGVMGAQTAAMGIGLDGKVAWSIASSGSLTCARKIMCSEEYD